MERPILFSGPMVRAILDGRKTQTRRVLKVPETHGHFVGIYAPGLTAVFSHDVSVPHNDFSVRLIGKGTELWVREGFATVSFGGAVTDGIYYQADVDGTHRFLTREGTWETHKDGQFHRRPDKWKPSIHMPRWASRITLRVTAVKVERLQDISDEDAKAEGIFQTNAGSWSAVEGYAPLAGQSPKGGFYCLWTSINGPGSWDANPWVVAYSFERVLPK